MSLSTSQSADLQPLQVLVIGGSDTGRSPIVAALLRRELLARQLNWRVESAGLLGHSGSPIQPEARGAATALGLDLSEYQARLIDDYVLSAAVLLTVDSGLARALQAQQPNLAARVHSLPQLAGVGREVPDPFRMSVGTWMIYAQQLETQVRAVCPRLIALLQHAPPAGAGEQPGLTAQQQLAALISGNGHWPAVQAALQTLLDSEQRRRAGDDLGLAYLGVLRAALALTPGQPGIAQLQALEAGLLVLERPISAADLATLSAQLPVWHELVS